MKDGGPIELETTEAARRVAYILVMGANAMPDVVGGESAKLVEDISNEET